MTANVKDRHSELVHTFVRFRPVILGPLNRRGTMKKRILTLIVTTAVVGGVVALTIPFTTPYDEPARANAAAGIDPFLLMSHAVNLPADHYDDYSLVFN